MLTISVYSSTTLSVVKALDLGSLGGNDDVPGIGLGNICFASDCTNQNIKDNQNSPVVTDSENTNIESGEGDLNHGTNPGLGGEDENGVLSVEISIQCQGRSDFCNDAQSLNQYPTAQDYSITVSGNNPNPSNFNGSNTVELGAGGFTITETFDITPLVEAVSAEFGFFTVSSFSAMSGDCKFNNQNKNSITGTGTMSPGGSQVCNILNILVTSDIGPN